MHIWIINIQKLKNFNSAITTAVFIVYYCKWLHP